MWRKEKMCEKDLSGNIRPYVAYSMDIISTDRHPNNIS